MGGGQFRLLLQGGDIGVADPDDHIGRARLQVQQSRLIIEDRLDHQALQLGFARLPIIGKAGEGDVIALLVLGNLERTGADRMVVDRRQALLRVDEQPGQAVECQVGRAVVDHLDGIVIDLDRPLGVDEAIAEVMTNLLIPRPFDGPQHVIGLQLATVVKFDPLAEIECVFGTIRAHRPALRQPRLDGLTNDAQRRLEDDGLQIVIVDVIEGIPGVQIDVDRQRQALPFLGARHPTPTGARCGGQNQQSTDNYLIHSPTPFRFYAGLPHATWGSRCCSCCRVCRIACRLSPGVRASMTQVGASRKPPPEPSCTAARTMLLTCSGLSRCRL